MYFPFQCKMREVILYVPEYSSMLFLMNVCWDLWPSLELGLFVRAGAASPLPFMQDIWSATSSSRTQSNIFTCESMFQP